MKRIVLLYVFLAVAISTQAQINAITESGDQVVLYSDGTWKYVEESQEEEEEIPENPKKFKKDKDATFLVKSKNVNVGVWINPKTWIFEKGTDKDDYEFQFQKKGEDLYAMLLTEKISIPIENLAEIAIENAKEVSPDLKVMKKEYRNVNGVKVLMMKMKGTIQGVKFVYYGYYYSNSEGSIQFLTFTGEKLMKEYKKDIERFLNGFVEL